MLALRFLPPLAWTAVILRFSTSQWSGAQTGSALLPLLRAVLPWAAPEQLDFLHWLIRETGHVVEYGVLGGLWLWTLGGGLKALIPTLITAVLDEANQAFTFARSGSPADLALDAAAAGAAIYVLGGRAGAPLGRLTEALLWLAAGGGTTLLVLHVAAAAPAAWLWLSVPAAWIALWLRRRQRRAPPPREAPAGSREAPPESAETGQ